MGNNTQIIGYISARHEDTEYGRIMYDAIHAPGARVHNKKIQNYEGLQKLREIIFHLIPAVEYSEKYRCQTNDSASSKLLKLFYGWLGSLTLAHPQDFDNYVVSHSLQYPEMYRGINIPDLHGPIFSQYIDELDHLTNDVIGGFERGYRIGREIYKRLLMFRRHTEQHFGFCDYFAEKCYPDTNSQTPSIE